MTTGEENGKLLNIADMEKELSEHETAILEKEPGAPGIVEGIEQQWPGVTGEEKTGADQGRDNGQGPNKRIAGGRIDPRNPPADFNPFVFNPKYHQPGPEGEGVKNGNSHFRLLGGRPRKGGTITQTVDQMDQEIISRLPPPEMLKQIDQGAAGEVDQGAAGEVDQGAAGLSLPGLNGNAAGLTAASLIFQVGETVGGDEWRPERVEFDNMAAVWGNWLQTKGIDDISPGAAVLLQMGAYMGPRFARPKTRGKLALAWAWLKFKFSWGNKKDASVNCRADIKRENPVDVVIDQEVSKEGDIFRRFNLA